MRSRWKIQCLVAHVWKCRFSSEGSHAGEMEDFKMNRPNLRSKDPLKRKPALRLYSRGLKFQQRNTIFSEGWANWTSKKRRGLGPKGRKDAGALCLKCFEVWCLADPCTAGKQAVRFWSQGEMILLFLLLLLFPCWCPVWIKLICKHYI